jgi:anti-anti-sigma factor
MEDRWEQPPVTSVRPDFEAASHPLGAAIVVELHGELDLFSAERARKELAAALKSEPDWLIADLSGINLLDSTGLKTLLDAADDDACEFAVLCPGGLHARGVLSVSGVLETLTTFESRDELRHHLGVDDPEA